MLRLSFTAGLFAAAILLAPQFASAVPLAPQASAVPAAAAEGALVEKAQWRCRYWRNVCAARWGWGTPRFHICIGRHAC
jgi:hypothetical protein